VHRFDEDHVVRFGVALIATKSVNVGLEEFRGALEEFGAHVGEGLPLTARVAVHGDHDPFEDGVWGRCQDARIDGVVDFRFEGEEPSAGLLEHLDAARDALGPAVARGRSTAVAGQAHLLVDKAPTSPWSLVCAVRRDPASDGQELRRWWTREHSVWMRPYFARSSQRFEVILGDDELTRLVCATLRVGGARYEFFEHHTFTDWDAFEGTFSGETNALALKDEFGHLDAERGMRVGWLAQQHSDAA
jgi:hypothetical protein